MINTSPLRLFSEIDQVPLGEERGLLCFTPFPDEGDHRLDVQGVFTANLGGLTVVVERAAFAAFLNRNPNLDRGTSPEPENILRKLWSDRSPSPSLSSPPLKISRQRLRFNGCLGEWMQKKDSSVCNVFLFYKKHYRSFNPHDFHLKTNPFQTLNTILSTCDSRAPIEDRAQLFKQHLAVMVAKDKELAKAFGLRDPAAIDLVVHDLVEYLQSAQTPVFEYTASFDETTKVYLRQEIEQITEESKRLNVGSISQRVSVKCPDKILLCKKISPLKYELSLIDFHPLSENKKREIVQTLSRAGIPSQNIDLILFGLQSHWHGFYESSGQEGSVAQQIHDVKGLKIFYNREGKLVADIAIGPVSCGAFKVIKKKFTLFLDGTLEENVRYSGHKEDLGGGSFSHDISQEILNRKLLGSIPHLLDIYMNGLYVGKKRGIRKTRYEAKFCRGNVDGLIFGRDGRPLPLGSRQTLRALHMACEALSALAAMHAKGFVHNDVKLENILFTDSGEGLLSDLGFMTAKQDPYLNEGTLLYSAPERLWPELLPEHNLPESDVFAFGLTLLFIYSPNLYNEFHILQERAVNQSAPIPLSCDEYKRQFEKLRGSLGTSVFERFIADLLFFDYKLRPTSEQALVRFSAILPSLENELRVVP